MKSSSSSGRSKTKLKYGDNFEKDLPKFRKPGGGGGDPKSKSPPMPPTAKKVSKPKISLKVGTAKSKPKKFSSTASIATGTRGPERGGSASSSVSSIQNKRAGPPPPVPRRGECEVCKQPCRSHCAGCKRVFYCSKQHQQADWAKHKFVCRPFSIPTQYSSGFNLRGSSTASITPTNSSGNNNNFGGNLGPEMQFMIATKQITAGSVIFSEKPILVTANVLEGGTGTEGSGRFQPLCCSCFQLIKPVITKNDSTSSPRIKFPSCPKCDLPLCAMCLVMISEGGGGTGPAPPKNLHPGQGHSTEECVFLKDLQQKFPELMEKLITLGTKKEEMFNFLKDLSMLRILMFRTACLWRWENLVALRNSPRYQACVKHNFGEMGEWLKGDFLMSDYYMKNICKEKSLQLTDLIKICAVFCEKSPQNPNWLLLYENRSWIPHACTPNSELFYRQLQNDPTSTTPNELNPNALEIIIKAVDNIEEGSRVTMNYLQNFEGGRSALAVKLFQSKGLYCCVTECPCYQRGFDKTLGVRCDLFPNASGEVQACSGVLSPKVEAPNPDKSNLGLGIFLKSKKWECDKCLKSDKYVNLHPKIVQIAQDLSENCERCCSGSTKNGLSSKFSPASYLQFQTKLFSAVSSQHWMVWKAKLRIMRTWTEAYGTGPEMLRVVVSLGRPGESSSSRESLIYTVKQKADIYGGGIYDNPKSARSSGGKSPRSKMGLLEYMALRHGDLSPRRGDMLFDAFFANLILLLEDYRKEFPTTSSDSTSRRLQDLKWNQVARENCKKIGVLKGLLEKCIECFKLCEGTTKMNSEKLSKNLRIALESLEVLKAVHTQIQKTPRMVIPQLNEFLELYLCQDQNFILNSVKASRPRRDPFRSGVDDLEFEVDPLNFGPQGATYSFGVATSNSSSASTFRSYGSSASASTFKPNKSRFTTFNRSTGGGAGGRGASSFSSSSSFPFSTDSKFPSSEEDNDDNDDNPFVYSRGVNFAKKPAAKKGPTSSKAKNNAKKDHHPKNKISEDEDWSSYFWFSSDEDDDQDNDEEFDFGFSSHAHHHSTPPPRFGEDLFNDDELEDLAEWAALQFMMGKMKV